MIHCQRFKEESKLHFATIFTLATVRPLLYAFLLQEMARPTIRRLWAGLQLKGYSAKRTVTKGRSLSPFLLCKEGRLGTNLKVANCLIKLRR